jgi:hypothetical protein
LLGFFFHRAQAAGASKDSANNFVGAFFHAMASTADPPPDGGFAGLMEHAATPGGLNEQVGRAHFSRKTLLLLSDINTWCV